MTESELNEALRPENARRQFEELKVFLNASFRERMKTPEGKESLRNDIAAMQGRHPSEVKFEGE